MSSGNYADVFGRADGGVRVQVPVCVQVPLCAGTTRFSPVCKRPQSHMNIIDTY